MHLAQALTLLPFSRRTHCKLGYFLLLTVGLYLPLSFFLTPNIREPFPQIVHIFAIVLLDFLRNNPFYSTSKFWLQIVQSSSTMLLHRFLALHNFRTKFLCFATKNYYAVGLNLVQDLESIIKGYSPVFVRSLGNAKVNFYTSLVSLTN